MRSFLSFMKLVVLQRSLLELEPLNFTLAVIAGIIANWLYQFLFEKRSSFAGMLSPEWLINLLDNARVLLPVWFRKYIARKYGLNSPGKFVVDRYMRGLASKTLMPESPMYVSTANNKVLQEAFCYAAGHPDRINHVFDFAIRFAQNGVFYDNRAIHEFLSQVEESGANRGRQLTIEQPVWNEMIEEEQRNVTIPGELIDEYLKNLGAWYIMSRVVIFGSVFIGVIWLV